jgi:hypothetical protein
MQTSIDAHTTNEAFAKGRTSNYLKGDKTSNPLSPIQV